MFNLNSRFPAMQHTAHRRKWIYEAISFGERADDDIHYRLRAALYNWAIAGLRQITPRELLTVFLPTKIVDGERFQCNDYFRRTARSTLRLRSAVICSIPGGSV